MSQVQTFLDEAQKVAAATPAPDGAQPKVPFQSDLKLTAEQEKKMIEHAFKRYGTLKNELGRDQTLQPQWWMNQSQGNTALANQGLQPADTFLGKRTRFDAMYMNDVSWRPWTTQQPNIFQDSNLAVPLVRRICRQMIARAKNSFFGSDPWLSIGPAPVPEFDAQKDAERAQAIERFCRYKLGESGSKEDKERAIRLALVLGECAVKTSYVVRDQLFNVEATVLTDINGDPVRAADGNHITPDDQFVDVEDGSGRKVLQRDGQTEEPLAPVWQKVPLNRRQVLFEGPKSEPIYFKDFLCPITATDVQTADCIVHLYDKPVMEFVDLVVKRGMVGDTADDRAGAARRMVALVKQLSNNSPQPKAAVNMEVRPGEYYQTNAETETGGPISEFAEFYLWFDANGDGVAENIMLICDRNSQAPIFYDHVANVTTDGLRPIEVVRINPVEGRWYGLGIFELFESYQVTVDLLVNRWNFSQSRAGRVDFWRPNDTQEGDRNPNLAMNWGGTYTAKPGIDPDKILTSKYLTDIKFEQVKMMIEFFLQLAYNESGVATANDSQMAGMESSKLATGIIEVQQSGDELFKPIVSDLRGPLTRILNREIDVTLANMNPVEVFTYLEGDTEGIDKITPEDVRGLKMKCVIEMTAMKNNHQLQMSAQAAALVEKFYMLTPEVQAKVVGFYRRQLRVLDPAADADTAIQPIAPTPPAAEPTKSGINLSIKWETLTPEEKQLFAAKMDVDDANPPPAAPVKNNGSAHKLGESNGSAAVSATQLGQRDTQMKGVSARGGTAARN